MRQQAHELLKRQTRSGFGIIAQAVGTSARPGDLQHSVCYIKLALPDCNIRFGGKDTCVTAATKLAMSPAKGLVFLWLTLFLGLLLQPSCSRLASATGGPCTAVEQAKIVDVRSASDILTRTNYPNTQTVILRLQNDITVSQSIQFTEKYQCTIFRSATGNQGLGFNVSTANDSVPAILIWNTNNVLIQNVGFRLPDQETYANCSTTLPDGDSDNANCPAISVFSSWGVQIVQATIHGRMDVLRTNQTLLDSLLILTKLSNFAAVRLSYNGDGPNLQRSDVVISNSRIYGSTDGIILYRQTVGVTIANNYLENNFFTAIQCGKNAHNVGDCMLTNIVNNYIHVTPGFNTTADSGSIYFDTHWVNPGNRLSCNYIINGVHCIYFDWASSGVIVEGGACYNTTNGVKLNTGKNNQVSSLVVVEPSYQAGWISCQNYDINNCALDPGSFWESTRIAQYNSAAIQKAYPYLTNFCARTSINGINCNPPGTEPTAAVTGNCSGIPTENSLRITVVDPQRYNKSLPAYLANCDGLQSVPNLNTISYDVYDAEQVQFLNEGALDFGVQPSSVVYDNEPGFKSCPRSAVGVKAVNSTLYAAQFFNSPREEGFWENAKFVPAL